MLQFIVCFALCFIYSADVAIPNAVVVAAPQSATSQVDPPFRFAPNPASPNPSPNNPVVAGPAVSPAVKPAVSPAVNPVQNPATTPANAVPAAPAGSKPIIANYGLR